MSGSKHKPSESVIIGTVVLCGIVFMALAAGLPFIVALRLRRRQQQIEIETESAQSGTELYSIESGQSPSAWFGSSRSSSSRRTARDVASSRVGLTGGEREPGPPPSAWLGSGKNVTAPVDSRDKFTPCSPNVPTRPQPSYASGQKYSMDRELRRRREESKKRLAEKKGTGVGAFGEGMTVSHEEGPEAVAIPARVLYVALK